MMTPRHTNANRARGFTLIEVLLAVVIFAIVLAAMSTVFYSALRLRNRTAAHLEEKLPIQHATAIMQRDLAGLVAPGGMLASNLTTAASGAMQAQNATPFFVNTGNIDDTSPWGEVQKVAYYLTDSTNQPGSKDLMRAVTRNLLAPAEEVPVTQWLMSGVRNLAFSFYDGTAWTETWDSSVTTNLPTAIKVQIELASLDAGQPVETPMEFVVPVVVQIRTNQTKKAVAATGGGE